MILFNVRQPNLLSHLRPIIEAIIPVYPEIGFVVGREEQVNSLKSLFEVDTWVLEDEVGSVLGRGVCVSACMHSKAPQGFFHVNVLHGQPVKYLTYDSSLLGQFDAFFVYGQFQNQWVKNLYQNAGMDMPQIYPTGLPLIDKFFNSNKISADETKESLGISSDRPIVAYAPSWNPGLPIRTNPIDVIKYLTELSKDVTVCIRLHPNFFHFANHPEKGKYTGDINWPEVIDIENLIDCSTLDLWRLLTITDLLISDCSSITWDFLACNIPFVWQQPISIENFLKSNPQFGGYSSHTFLSTDTLNGGIRHRSGEVSFGLKSWNSEVMRCIKDDDSSELDLLYNKGFSTPYSALLIIRLIQELKYS